MAQDGRKRTYKSLFLLFLDFLNPDLRHFSYIVIDKTDVKIVLNENTIGDTPSNYYYYYCINEATLQDNSHNI